MKIIPKLFKPLTYIQNSKFPVYVNGPSCVISIKIISSNFNIVLLPESYSIL